MTTVVVTAVVTVVMLNCWLLENVRLGMRTAVNQLTEHCFMFQNVSEVQ